MLGGSSTAAATLSTNTSTATPTSPTRPSRLRGLSYLRNYTQNHLHSSSSATTTPSRSTGLSRTKSSPGSSSSPIRASLPVSPPISRDSAPSPQRSVTAGSSTTGWVPTVGGQSGFSRSSTQSQQALADASPSDQTPTPTMTRDRAATVTERPTVGLMEGDVTNETDNSTGNAAGEKKETMPSLRLIPHQEPRSTRPSLTFPTINRTLQTPTSVVRVGRYSERDINAAEALTNPHSSAPVGFKSKVVSRRHCEFWCSNNQWYVKDVKSSSGTFLNHVRLSSPGQESRPYPVNDGDIVQLGIDFKGGEEIIFRCVKIRVECNRGWQKAPNPFNTSTHKRLRNLAKSGSSRKDSDAQSVNSSECSICLNAVAPCQALFVAPCSHVWHYKCIRTLVYANWPSFQCPNCRAYADLEADVEQAEAEDLSEDEDYQEAIAASTTGSASEDVKVGASTTNASRGVPNSAASEDELAGLLDSASLNGHTDTPVANQESTASRSIPVPIVVSPRSPGSEFGPRSATPTSTAQFSLAAGLAQLSDGPQTPRNDSPFVLDSTAGGSMRSREVDSVEEETAEYGEGGEEQYEEDEEEQRVAMPA